MYFTLTGRLRLQANVENLFDRTFYLNADSNTNISPGSPRAVRVALVREILTADSENCTVTL